MMWVVAFISGPVNPSTAVNVDSVCNGTGEPFMRPEHCRGIVHGFFTK